MTSAERPASGDALAAIRVVFFQECDEQLATLEAALLAIDDGQRDPEFVNAAFRAVHSIKGGASALELGRLSSFAHHFETVLAAARSQTIALEAEPIRVLLRAADALADLVRVARNDAPIDERFLSVTQAELIVLAGEPEEGEGELALIDFVPRPAEFTLPSAPEAVEWIVRFRPYADLYSKANEPLRLLRQLKSLGPLDVVVDDGALPTLDALEPEEGYLSWTATLRGGPHEERVIRDVFEFVEGDCDLEIVAHANSTDDVTAAAVPSTMVDQERARTAREAGGGEGVSRAPAAQTIRVDIGRLDELANLVGELVINHALLSQRISGQTQ